MKSGEAIDDQILEEVSKADLRQGSYEVISPDPQYFESVSKRSPKESRVIKKLEALTSPSFQIAKAL